MSNTIFYKTTADFDNTGEVLIYKSLLEFLRKYGNVIVNDGVGIQPKFLNRIGIVDKERLSKKTSLKFIPYMIFKSIIGIFKRDKIFFVTGVGEHSVVGIKCVVKNIVSFLFLLILRLCGVTIVRIGMSMRIQGTMAALSEKLLSRMINHYYVRDSISLNNCKKAGVKKCKMAPDLSWGYKVPNEDQCKNRKDIYMSFRFFCESKNGCGLYQEKIISVIKQIVAEIHDKIDGNIVFSFQCDEDKSFMESIFLQLSHIPNLIMSKELITLDNANSYYGNAKVILSNRLHVLLLGYKFGAPTICITDKEKHRKIQGIFSDNGLLGNLIDFNIPENQLIANIIHILDNCNAIEGQYRIAEENNYSHLSNVFKHIFEK